MTDFLLEILTEEMPPSHVITGMEQLRTGMIDLLDSYKIEYSLENGFEPRWDALTPTSSGLAKKLGYTNPEKYQMLILEEK